MDGQNCHNIAYSIPRQSIVKTKLSKLESVSIAESLQNRQHAQNPLMLSTLGREGRIYVERKGEREGGRE